MCPSDCEYITDVTGGSHCFRDNQDFKNTRRSNFISGSHQTKISVISTVRDLAAFNQNEVVTFYFCLYV